MMIERSLSSGKERKNWTLRDNEHQPKQDPFHKCGPISETKENSIFFESIRKLHVCR
jgi:hypothetical protein